MRQIIILLILLAVSINRLFCQTTFDDSLLLLEQKIFICKNDSEKSALRLNKLDAYFSKNDFSEQALKEAKRIDYSFLKSKSDQKYFLWNASVLAYMNNEKRASFQWYNAYQQFYPDSGMQSLLLGFISTSEFDSTLSKLYVRKISMHDSEAICLSCLNKLQNYKRKHRGLYIAASAVIPGSGSIVNGNITKGFVSLAVNSGAWFMTYALLKSNLYVNAVLLGVGMSVKFYAGNIQLTKKLFGQKEAIQKNVLAKECQLRVDKLLNQYPIEIQTVR
jgi:hypothetical protein